MPSTPTLFMFSGQGSQYYEMGGELFSKDGGFRAQMLELDAIATPLLGQSVVDLLYHQGRKKSETFDRTRLTGPAILMVELALARTLMAHGVMPDAVLGASQGTMAAACVAGCLSPQDALSASVKKAEILEASCAAGTMVAILCNPQLYLDEPELHEQSELAGINCASHFVVAVVKDKLGGITRFLQQREIAHQVLAVSQAFHSRLIDGARDPCLRLFRELPLQSPRMPLICCAAQGRLESLGAEALWRVMREPIHFERTISTLEAEGPWRYIDVGPAGSLATMLKYGLLSRPSSSVHSILRPFGGDYTSFQRVLELKDA